MEEFIKALLTGVCGQLGYDICKELGCQSIEYCGTSSQEMDITDQNTIMDKIKTYHPDAVIRCVVYTAVDQADEEPERAFAVNEYGTCDVAEVCKEIGSKNLYSQPQTTV